MKHLGHIIVQIFKVAAGLFLILAIFSVVHDYLNFCVPVQFQDELENTKVLLTKMKVDPKKLNEFSVAVKTASRLTGFAEELLIALVYTESRWKITAHSPKGYKGLAQIPYDLWYPDVNILTGAKILAEKMVESNGDLKQALMRYKGYKDLTSKEGEKDAERVIGIARNLRNSKVRNGEI